MKSNGSGCLHVPINIPALSAYVGSKAQINTGLLAHGSLGGVDVFWHSMSTRGFRGGPIWAPLSSGSALRWFPIRIGMKWFFCDGAWPCCGTPPLTKVPPGLSDLLYQYFAAWLVYEIIHGRTYCSLLVAEGSFKISAVVVFLDTGRDVLTQGDKELLLYILCCVTLF